MYTSAARAQSSEFYHESTIGESAGGRLPSGQLKHLNLKSLV